MVEATNLNAFPGKVLSNFLAASQRDRNDGLISKGGNNVFEIRTNSMQAFTIAELVCYPHHSHICSR